MPTYQYQCDNCGFEFEEFQRISDNPIEICPECGGHTHRVISGGAGFLLKGSGFYTTDYRPSSYKEAAKKEKETSDPPKPKEKKKDTKTAA